MRIIAGSAKGRTFEALEGRSTRPTLDRVREAMFGMIQFDVENADVLDLFAGSGALGLEALSRGARHAVFCDSDRSAAKLVEKNLQKLGFADMAEVFCRDALGLLRSLADQKRRFSLVLLDPPYEAGLYEPVLKQLLELGLLRAGCIVILEHNYLSPVEAPSERFKAGKPHRYGDVGVTKFVYTGFDPLEET